MVFKIFVYLPILVLIAEVIFLWRLAKLWRENHKSVSNWLHTPASNAYVERLRLRALPFFYAAVGVISLTVCGLLILITILAASSLKTQLNDMLNPPAPTPTPSAPAFTSAGGGKAGGGTEHRSHGGRRR